jgi:signal peptidase I
MQFLYSVSSSSGSFNAKKLEDFGISLYDANQDQRGLTYFNLDATQVEKIKSLGLQAERVKRPPQPGYLFPNNPKQHAEWTVDDYGPVWVPKKGATTPLNMTNIAFYWRVISVYEENKLEIRDNKIYINGAEASSYTFKQNYYWMQGDNRHNSEDSRYWGYVPEDHIVGKPLFIWFSTKGGSIKNGINWGRIFKSASAN